MNKEMKKISIMYCVIWVVALAILAAGLFAPLINIGAGIFNISLVDVFSISEKIKSFESALKDSAGALMGNLSPADITSQVSAISYDIIFLFIIPQVLVLLITFFVPITKNRTYEWISILSVIAFMTMMVVAKFTFNDYGYLGKIYLFNWMAGIILLSDVIIYRSRMSKFLIRKPGEKKSSISSQGSEKGVSARVSERKPQDFQQNRDADIREAHKRRMQQSNSSSDTNEKQVSSDSSSEKKCPECGSVLEGNSRFCTNCGSKTSDGATAERKCPGCNEIVDKDSSFCINCGSKLK